MGAEGVLFGAMIFLAGVMFGGVGVWWIVRYYEDERARLYSILGGMQARRGMENDLEIPEEEM